MTTARTPVDTPLGVAVAALTDAGRPDLVMHIIGYQTAGDFYLDLVDDPVELGLTAADLDLIDRAAALGLAFWTGQQ